MAARHPNSSLGSAGFKEYHLTVTWCQVTAANPETGPVFSMPIAVSNVQGT